MKKRNKLSKNSLIILLLVSCILISGCVFTSSGNNLSTNTLADKTHFNQTAQEPITPVITPLPEDFPIHISEEFINNSSAPIVMNYSEIVAHDYTDIPVAPDLAGRKTGSFCGYSGNLSKISEISLNDDRVKKILNDGGIIEDVDQFNPYEMMNGDVCYHFYFGLRLEYKGQQNMVYVNESAMNVEFID
jgi:hypothetical protein